VAVKSWLLLLACNLMWALQFTCIKLVEDQVGTYMTVWAPMVLATIGILPFLRHERQHSEFKDRVMTKRDVLNFLLVATFGMAPAQVLVTEGTRLTLASNAALLTLALPILTAVLAVIILHEKMNRIRWLSFALAIGGVVLCSLKDLQGLDLGSKYVWGNALIMLGIIGNSFTNSYGKVVLRRFTPMEMLFFCYVCMDLLLLPFVWRERDFFGRIPHWTVNTWIGMVILTVFHNYLSNVLFFKALKSLDAIQAALSGYLVTMFGVPIAVIWLGERLSPLAAFGGVLVFGSTLMITVWEDLRRKPEGNAA
jgi:drug/metabolite transporter (DMT)-like permease